MLCMVGRHVARKLAQGIALKRWRAILQRPVPPHMGKGPGRRLRKADRLELRWLSWDVVAGLGAPGRKKPGIVVVYTGQGIAWDVGFKCT